jgi:hypothetical protein
VRAALGIALPSPFPVVCMCVPSCTAAQPAATSAVRLAQVLQTKADGNCLLHSTMLGTIGLHDTWQLQGVSAFVRLCVRACVRARVCVCACARARVCVHIDSKSSCDAVSGIATLRLALRASAAAVHGSGVGRDGSEPSVSTVSTGSSTLQNALNTVLEHPRSAFAF